MSALVLTYHAIEDGPGPLFVSPELFEVHLDAILESGAEVLTIGELAAALREGRLPERAVAITFDDGFASVARAAAPLLRERGLTATVFCVAGYVGRDNDWPSQPPKIPRRPLAAAEELAELARDGIELGAHGMTHAPLSDDVEESFERELVEARGELEKATGVEIRSFAYPYGGVASPAARTKVAATYEAACTTELRLLVSSEDSLAIPRVDAHYVRRPALLRRALDGSLGGYLRARRLGSRARSLFLADAAAAR